MVEPEVLDYSVRLSVLDELRESALDHLTETQRAMVRQRLKRSSRTEPEIGDLILLRRLIVDKEKGRKLEPRWVGPYFLTRFTRGGRSVFYSSVFDKRIEVGRKHLDQVMLYCPREERPTDVEAAQAAEEEEYGLIWEAFEREMRLDEV
jgi:hypothetical protein